MINKMTNKLINKINERIEILKLLATPGYTPMIFNYPYESEINLKNGKNQKPIFNKLNFSESYKK